LVAYTAYTSAASVHFSDHSVKLQECSIVTLAVSSAELFKDEPVVTLSSAFAKFKKETPYAAQNDKDAVVGALLGDGVEIVFDNALESVELCFTLRPAVRDAADKDRFPVLDFGYASKDLASVQPLGVEVTVVS
jgi:hypothetical protein